MILKNPTEFKLSVQIFGKDYHIDPLGKSGNLPDEVAEYWMTLHKFLLKDTVVVKEEVKEVKEVKEEKKVTKE